MNILAIIPARGGSKRIPRKNVKEFQGQPIIGYSISAALRSGCFSRVMVSTDSEEIATEARHYGAEVPFLRSEATANDYATTADVIREVLDEYERRGERFDAICCIYATAPFILPFRLREGRGILEAGHEAAFTCVEYSYPVQRGLEIGADGRIAMRWPQYAASRSQDLTPTYHDAGQFYFCRTEAFRRDNTLWGPDALPIVLPELEVQDLDTPTDWRLAEIKYSLLAFPAEIRLGDFRLVAYPELSDDIHEQMLAGRNADDVRKWMVNQGIISAHDHRNFVESLRYRRDKQYYAVFDSNDALLGTVNLEWVSPDAMERGIWLTAASRGRGVAKRLLSDLYAWLAANKGVSRIETRVHRLNRASIALEHSLGAREIRSGEDFNFYERELQK